MRVQVSRAVREGVVRLDGGKGEGRFKVARPRAYSFTSVRLPGRTCAKPPVSFPSLIYAAFSNLIQRRLTMPIISYNIFAKYGAAPSIETSLCCQKARVGDALQRKRLRSVVDFHPQVLPAANNSAEVDPQPWSPGQGSHLPWGPNLSLSSDLGILATPTPWSVIGAQ